MRLINAETLLESILAAGPGETCKYCFPCREMIQAIDEQPTIEEICVAKVLYLCNGQKEDCAKTGCYINGGECKHTTDEKYAANEADRRKFRMMNHCMVEEESD